MQPPKTITIKSDKNILTLHEVLSPAKKTELFIYKYTKSETKKGQFLGLTEKELETLIKNNPQ